MHVLKTYKIEQLESILRQGIETKYKISFMKGMQLVSESIILFVLMLSVVLKANLFSLIYMAFIVKYVVSRNKSFLLVRMIVYIAICFMAQYMLFMLNLTDAVSPSHFPEQFEEYPRNKDPNNMELRYMLPFFFQFECFRDLTLSYLIGIGIDKV
jgi:hypothetical protein